jgi:hypothetical protein
VCQLTLRCDTGIQLLEKAKGAIAHLMENGCMPYYYGNGPSPKNNGKQAGDEASWCPIHECEMNRYEKNGHAWYSHKVGDTWCKGK